ncbi:MAG TPA: hypothetical protein PKA06_01870 [Gemmatales bacterium]|nr:hypothetical protein [Gemmatales bacterium]HMP17183.1 hypothetical protein [Gemmatales bacterium]
MSKMNCQIAQEHFQELLDQRRTGPLLPEVDDHLRQCLSCHSWHILLHRLPYQVNLSTSKNLPESFANKVLNRYQRERRFNDWKLGGGLLALAASMLVAFIYWNTNLTQHHEPVWNTESNLAEMRSRKLLEQVRTQLATLQHRAATLEPPSFTWPQMLTRWELRETDPLELGRPALKTISHTIQGAMEPFEEPARAAYYRVKSILEDAEWKKWLQRLQKKSA